MTGMPLLNPSVMVVKLCVADVDGDEFVDVGLCEWLLFE